MYIEVAKAKINLGLRVLGKRADGYHEVDMLMQSIELADQLTFVRDSQLTLQLDNQQLQADPQENLIIKAARVLAAHTGFKCGAKITLQKRIPIAAGLAGGSSDAAATLRGLNRLWQTGLTMRELENLATQIGSDVAFCVQGGTQRATGRGEILQPLAPLPKMNLVVFKPNFGVSTQKVYQAFNLQKVTRKVDIGQLITAVQTAKIEEIIASMGNDLESVTLALHPEIGLIKRAMLDWGASYALMSGSGPTVFAVVDNLAIARKIVEELPKEHLGDSYLTSTCS